MKSKLWILLLLILIMLALLPSAMAVQNGDERIAGECPMGPSETPDGHHHYFAEVLEPTCERPGRVWWICYYCGSQYTEELPALGHNWLERAYYEKEGTCVEPGERWYSRVCSRCGYQGEDRIEYTGLGAHQYGDFKQDEAPQCEKNGLKYRTCTLCGHQDWQYIKALGHLWDEGVVTKAPTATEPGEKTFTCKRNASHTKVEEIPAGSWAVLPAHAVEAGLQITVSQTSEIKPVYAPDEVLTFDITLTNTGDADMTDPVIEYSYLIYGTQYVMEIGPDKLGTNELNKGQFVAVAIAIPVSDTAVDEGYQLLFAQGHATMPPDAGAPEEMAEYAVDGKLYTLPSTSTFPVFKDSGLVLTVTQTSPAKSVYHLNDDIAWEAVLTNNGSDTVVMAGVDQTWVEDSSSHTYTDLKDLAPGESYICSDSDFIMDTDVGNGILTLAFTGNAYKQGTGEEITSNAVILSFPTEEYIPPEGHPALFLQVIPKDYVSSYEVDGMGSTQEIPFTVTVTNTGDTEVDFSLLSIEISGRYADHTEPTQKLKPHGTYTFDVGGTVLNESDIIPGSGDTDILGKVRVVFKAVGYWPETLIESCASDEVILEYKLTEPGPWTPEPETSFTIKLTESSHHDNPKGYMEQDVIDYFIEITNTGEVTVASAKIHDILEDNGGDDVIAELTNLIPDEVRTLPYQYEVTKDDVDNLTVTNKAYITWDDDYHTGLRKDSDPVNSPTTKEPSPVRLKVEKAVNGDPANHLYYQPGEKIEFVITVTNIGEEIISNVNVWDVLATDYPAGLIASYPALNPAESVTVSFLYECTEWDAFFSPLTNTASADGYDPAGSATSAISNEVTVEIGKDQPDMRVLLTIDKEETSDPKNEKYYVEGEEIVYKITVENVNEIDLYDVDIIDSLEDPLAGSIAHFGILKPGEKQEIEYKYTVTADDVIQTKVINYAIADFWFGPKDVHLKDWAGPVESPTGENPPPPPPVISREDSCRLVLLSYGVKGVVSQQHICASHLKALNKAEEILSAAVTAEETAFASQQAAAVWRQALEEEYAAIIRSVTGEARAALQDDKTVFFMYLDSLEELLKQLYSDDTAKIYEIMAETCRSQVCEICYLRHNPGKSRPDSLFTGNYTRGDWETAANTVTCLHTCTRVRGNEIRIETAMCQEHNAIEKTASEVAAAAETRSAAEDTFRRVRRLWQAALDKSTNLRYKAADDGLRRIIAMNRTLFDKFIGTRTDVLNALYPRNPEIVSEVLCTMVRRQALFLCEIR